MKIRAGGEPYRNATATLMKIATGRSRQNVAISGGFCEWPEHQGFTRNDSSCCSSHHLLMRITTRTPLGLALTQLLTAITRKGDRGHG
jgi:hypothetical protein